MKSNVVELFPQDETEFGGGDEPPNLGHVTIQVSGPPELVDEYIARFHSEQPIDIEQSSPQKTGKVSWFWALIGALIGFNL
jgi:hypothetical protein